jgi:hypothetical protein
VVAGNHELVFEHRPSAPACGVGEDPTASRMLGKVDFLPP